MYHISSQCSSCLKISILAHEVIGSLSYTCYDILFFQKNFISLLFFLCAWEFCLHVCRCTTSMQCLWRSDEGIGFAGAVIVDSCEMPCRFWELVQVPWRSGQRPQPRSHLSCVCLCSLPLPPSMLSRFPHDLMRVFFSMHSFIPFHVTRIPLSFQNGVYLIYSGEDIFTINQPSGNQTFFFSSLRGLVELKMVN